ADEHLAPDVDVRQMASDRVRRDDHAFEQLVWVVFQDQAILEGARLALVGVHGQVDGLLGLLRQKAPLHPGWEARAAATAQIRGLHELHRLARLIRGERLARGLVPAVLQVHVDGSQAGDVPATGEESLGHSTGQEAAVSGSVVRSACFSRWILRCSAIRPSSTASGRGGQAGTETSTGRAPSIPGSVGELSEKPPEEAHAPKTITRLGSPICSNTRFRIGAWRTVTVPITIRRSAWRGVNRGSSAPNRSMSYGDMESDMNSMAQHAVANG